MAKTLADIWAENHQKQIDAGQAALRAHIGEHVVWVRVASYYGNAGGGETVHAIISGVKFGTCAWFILRDEAGREHRVRTHNVTRDGDYYRQIEGNGDVGDR